MRIAIALEAESPVLAHFGHAGRFHVYDDGEGAFRLLESRPNSPPCGAANTDALMTATVRVISDCSAVAAARFGPCALRETAVAGVFPFEMEGIPDDLLPTVLASLRDRLLRGRAKYEGRKVP
jgi:predicted Fe-Mo cluster-binding NifX family protein